MAETIKISIVIQKALFDQAETLAQRLNISKSHLFEIAIEDFIGNYLSLDDENNIASQDQAASNELSGSSYEDAKTVRQIGEGPRVINQGDVFWVQLEDAGG